MAEISVGDGVVSVILTTGEKAGGVHGDFSFPVSSIVTCIETPDPIDRMRGVRAPGAGFPNRKIGTWRGTGYKDYVSVERGHSGLIFGLANQDFARVLLSLPDAAASSDQLRAAGVVVTADNSAAD